jgi:hypothetical protein
MKVRVLVLLIALMALTFLPSSALAGGVNPAQLGQAGWSCMVAGPHGWVHCFAPAAGASPATITVMVFNIGDPNASNAEFLGTELLIHESLYNGQPCPQLDGPGGESQPYEYLFPEVGLPYYACHHFETD